MDHKSEDEELKKLAPHLFNGEKKNLFTIPDNYFEDLPGLIQERIQSEKRVSLVEVFSNWLLRPRIALGLILFALLLSGGLYFFQSRDGSPVTSEVVITFDDLKGSGAMDQIDENILIDELIAYNESSEASKIQDFDIENYLIENHTDYEQIINEL